MKKFCVIILVILVFTSSCQASPVPIDATSIQNTAVVMARTIVSQTQTSFTPTAIPTQVNKKQLLLDKVIPLLETKTYDSYQEAHLKLTNFLNDNPSFENDEEIQTLKIFASCMVSVKSGNNPVYCDYEKINPRYQGVFHSEIYAELSNRNIVGLQQWMLGYSIHATNVAINSLPIPQIGMSAQQVRNSQWGNPNHVNRTITASGTFEQWVYSNNRYVYLENGIVVTIQE